MNYSYDKCKYSPTTTNKSSIEHMHSTCNCGSNEFIVINANQTSSKMNTVLQCIKCGKGYKVYYD
jgi:hypothetical protein